MTFCLVGSWDEWRHFTELRPETSATSLVARVPVRRPPAMEDGTGLGEFDVYGNGDGFLANLHRISEISA